MALEIMTLMCDYLHRIMSGLAAVPYGPACSRLTSSVTSVGTGAQTCNSNILAVADLARDTTY